MIVLIKSFIIIYEIRIILPVNCRVKIECLVAEICMTENVMREPVETQ